MTFGGKRTKHSTVGKIRNTMIISGVLMVCLMTLLSYKVMKDNLMDEIKSSVMEVAKIAAANVDGDTFIEIAEGDDEVETDEFLAIHSKLSTFLEGENTEYIYTMKLLENGTMVFVVDTDPEEAAAAYEEYDEVADEMLECLEGKVTVDADITSDEWGEFLSAYAPIYDSNGNVVGLVGVDFLASSVKDKSTAFAKKMAVIDIICIVIAVVAAIIPAASLKKRLKLVNDKINDVVYNDGDLTKQIELSTGDEFQVISENLNAMLEQTRNVVSNVKTCSGRLYDVAFTVDGTMESATSEVEKINTDLKTMSDSASLVVSSLERIRSMVEAATKTIDEANSCTRNGHEIVNTISSISVEMIDEADESQRSILNETAIMRDSLIAMKKNAETVNQISDFTDEILNIAGQTRLLALNANIEAARAGEAGKGFSVVASNIGELADNSSTAATNIQQVSGQVCDVVENMMSLSEQMVEFLEGSVATQIVSMTKTGKRYAEDAEKVKSVMESLESTMETINHAVEDILNAVEVVTKATVENNVSLDQVSKSAQVLNENMTETMDLSQENRSFANDLGELVEHYTV